MNGPAMPENVAQVLRASAHPLDHVGAWGDLADQLGGARVVLLGEASHGTHEYYEWRSELTTRLVRDHGFDIIGVEGDWPDCFAVNQWLKDPKDHRSAHQVLHAFQRWPTWMWANQEMAHLLPTLKDVNAREGRNVGFFGLDVYSLRDSLARVTGFLDEHDPEAARRARRATACFDGDANGLDFPRLAGLASDECEEALERLLADVARTLSRDGRAPETDLDIEQNTRVALNAERYYRVMLKGNGDSWNVRDEHMTDTLARLLSFHGATSKAIVWAHNTHVGDARATDMVDAGLVNVGQLARERWPGQVRIVGAASGEGTVVAGANWEAPWRILEVPPARHNSWERVLADASPKPAWWRLPSSLKGYVRPHRAIGVVYHPEREAGNYVPTDLAERYDFMIHSSRSQALRPLELPVDANRVPETYPSGV